MRFVPKVFVAILAFAFIGCGVSSPAAPTTAFVFTAPSAGQTLRIGDPVVVSWSCDCAGYSFVLRVFAQNGGSVDISPRVTAKSFAWTVGATADSLVLLPGSYRLELVAFISDGYSLSPYHEIRGPSIGLTK